MGKIAIVTDSNSGITQRQARVMGIYVLPMPFYINGDMYYEDITLTQEEFYQRLAEEADISTSQPSPADVMEMWDDILKEYEEIIHIPMSSGLSSSCETAIALAQDYDGRVHVVDNQRISITQRQSVLDALMLAEQGMSAKEIVDVLLREKLEASIYITVDTLKYLKKGGRVTAAGAALGTVLNIKPVLQIQGEKLDAFAKVRGFKAAKKKMLDAIEKDITKRFAGKKIYLMAAYTCAEEEAEEWKKEIEARFPGYEVHMDPLSLSVSCHIGPGSMAVACCKVIDESLSSQA
ncbi:MAG: DegV family protein [Dorea sp.]|nr:DegV family protein [Dorea sp.]